MTTATQTSITRRQSDDITGFEGNGNGDRPLATVEIASSRQAQEVQAAMAVAKRFPRDQNAAYQRIMTACKRKGLAKEAMYEYPRGKEMVSGPSIRLAEALAQNWGNVDFGIIELEQRDRESIVMSYCWDLETNTRQTKIFTVPHERHTRRGVTELTDPRDIYEMVANQGARRLRSCILGIIPGDVVDAAVDACEKTLANVNGDAPLVDRIRAMLQVFNDQMNVTQQMVEAKLGHKVDTISERELIRLRKIYASIRDGMATRESHFELGQPADADEGANDLSERLGRPQQQRTQPAAAAAPAASDPEPEPAAGGEVSPSPSAPVSGAVDTDTGEVIEKEDPTLEELATWISLSNWAIGHYARYHHIEKADVVKGLDKWVATHLRAKDPKTGSKLRGDLAVAILEERLDLATGEVAEKA